MTEFNKYQADMSKRAPEFHTQLHCDSNLWSIAAPIPDNSNLQISFFNIQCCSVWNPAQFVI